MKTKKLKLVLLVGAGVAMLPTTIAASCNETVKTDTTTPETPSTDDKTTPVEPSKPETDGDKGSTPTPKPVEPVTPSGEGSGEKEKPTNPTTDETGKETKPVEPVDPTPEPEKPQEGGEAAKPEPEKPVTPAVDPATELKTAKADADKKIDALANLSTAVITTLKDEIKSAKDKEAVNLVVAKAEGLEAKTVLLVTSLAEANKLGKKVDTVFNSVKKSYNDALDAAKLLLNENKLKLATTTVKELEQAATKLDAQVKKVSDVAAQIAGHAQLLEKINTELGNENTTLGVGLKTELAKIPATLEQATEQNVNKGLKLYNLLQNLKSLQNDTVAALDLQTKYTRNYYNSTNKAEFDKALRNVLSVLSPYNFDKENVYSEVNVEGNNNPRLFANKRVAAEFKLENFIKLNENILSTEGANLDSTANLVKSYYETLKAETAKLNGDTNNSSKAYYKNPRNVVLHWNNFLPRIAKDFSELSTSLGESEATDLKNGAITKDEVSKLKNVVENDKKTTAKLQEWFSVKENLTELTNQLVIQLGSENINNVELSNPEFTYKHVYFKKTTKTTEPEKTTITYTVYSTPVVTFNVSAKTGFELLNEKDGHKPKLSIDLSILNNSSDSNKPYLYTSVYLTSITGKPVTKDVIKKSNEYLNDIIEYNGPAIPLDASSLVGKIGGVVEDVTKKTVNGTTNIPVKEFNDKFSSWLLTENAPKQNVQLRSILRNYIYKYDDRYNLNNITRSGESGIFVAYPILNTPERKKGNANTEAKPEEGYNLKFNNFSEVKSQFYVQQIEGDTNAVYVPLQAKTSEGWLRIFLVRIPLTKFIAPISPIVLPA
ncbi:hypothetical protein ACJA23_01035 [Mycoplasma corogypsi]|uniref:hypothetical protein n=1 Tax=Mycoplasma corogypsi TaxID=2106 RepID=UPI003872AB2F